MKLEEKFLTGQIIDSPVNLDRTLVKGNDFFYQDLDNETTVCLSKELDGGLLVGIKNSLGVEEEVNIPEEVFHKLLSFLVR